MIAKLSFLSLLFFIFSVALATNYYSGSSYFYDFPSCKNLNITMVCSNKIDSGEFYFSPNCFLVENQTYVNKWVCNCWNGYRLNFTIHPASNNSCDIYMVYTQTIELPERKEIYIRYSETPIIYNQTINQTVIERVVPYVPQEVNKTIEELKKALEIEEEINREIGRSREKIIEEYHKVIKENANLRRIIETLIIIIIILTIILVMAVKHFYKVGASK